MAARKTTARRLHWNGSPLQNTPPGLCPPALVLFAVVWFVTFMISAIYATEHTLRLQTSVYEVFDYVSLAEASAPPIVGPDDVVVFYHIFIPPNKGKHGHEQAKGIVAEQIEQVRDAMNNLKDTTNVDRKWVVYYSTTGVDSVISPRWMRQLCRRQQTIIANPRLSCHALGPHRTVGFEDLTLEQLYSFCRQPEHSNASSEMVPRGNTVVYMHSKGSYHSGGAAGPNHEWRRALTRAATGPCVKELVSSAQAGDDGQCNLCGLQFYPLWTTFFPGNIYAAHCSYVAKLYSPREYAIRLDDLLQTVNDTAAAHGVQWTHDLYNFGHDGNVGRGRFASEHWIASHPFARPCDATNTTAAISTFSKRRTLEKPKSRENSQTGKAQVLQSQETGGTVVTSVQSQNGTSILHTLPPLCSIFVHDPSGLKAAWQQLNPSWMISPAPSYSYENPCWYRLNHAKLAQIVNRTSGRLFVHSEENDGNQQQQERQPVQHEFFLLSGFVYRWVRLYQMVPPHDSWVWDWYPQGSEWREFLFGTSIASPEQAARTVFQRFTQ